MKNFLNFATVTKTELKKNYEDWLIFKYDYKFELTDCDRCLYDEDEKDELEEGKPSCETKGYCKHFGNIKNPPKGNPIKILETYGLYKFEEMSDSIINLSAYDGNNLPSCDFYPNYVGTIDMSEECFQGLLELKLTKQRLMILSNRQKQIERARHGS